MALRRLAAIVEYDGSAYSGWQSQAQAVCIQDTVEAALSFVAGQRVVAVCAGRTDRGVHALGQVVHFDTEALRTPRAWVLGSNSRLPPDIALRWAGEMPADFHARHRAERRTYRYAILNRSERSALQRLRSAWIHRSLDAQAMHQAAQVLVGEHDFSAFRSVECQSKTPVRRVQSIRVWREADFIWVEVSATAYLHHMVRNIVGTLLETQSMADAAGTLREILAARDRHQAGVTAPACGLYFWQVHYPGRFVLPELPRAAMLPPS